MKQKKLSLKKHPVLPSAYVTYDEQFIIYKDPKAQVMKWRWGFYVPNTGKYAPQPFEYRTLNDCKYDLIDQINEQETENELWQE